MAELKKGILSNIEYDFFKDKECLFVNGQLTLEDVKKINSSNDVTYLVFDNTKDQSSEIIGKLDSNKVVTIVFGGYDFRKKKKWNHRYYLERTLHYPDELSQIIQVFEEIERKIRPSWTTTEKCMFVYTVLAKEMHYPYDNESYRENGYKIVANLSGVLYKRLICTGFSIVFKEAMDRLGIFCDFQTMADHAWNIVKLEGEYRGIDLTWECTSKKGNKLGYKNFNYRKNFYGNEAHDISREPEEIRYNIVPFTADKIRSHFYRIEETMEKTIDTIECKESNIRFVAIYEKNNIFEYLVLYKNKIEIIYSSYNDIEMSQLSEQAIINAINNNHLIGLNEFPENYTKANVYERKDGTNFFIRRTGESIPRTNTHPIYEFDYYELSKDGSIKRYKILSESSLDTVTDTRAKEVIGNSLLSQERLSKKIQSFNGYVGYLKKDYSMIYNEEFEEQELHVYR